MIQAQTVEEVKTLRDQAQTIQIFLKQQGSCLDVQTQAAELKLRAERKLGALLKEQPKNAGAATPLHDERASIPTLADRGITEIQSHRWQKVASVPDFLYTCFSLYNPFNVRTLHPNRQLFAS